MHAALGQRAEPREERGDARHERQERPAGSQSLEFAVSGLPNGVYFARVDCNGRSATRRFVVMR